MTPIALEWFPVNETGADVHFKLGDIVLSNRDTDDIAIAETLYCQCSEIIDNPDNAECPVSKAVQASFIRTTDGIHILLLDLKGSQFKIDFDNEMARFYYTYSLYRALGIFIEQTSMFNYYDLDNEKP